MSLLNFLNDLVYFVGAQIIGLPPIDFADSGQRTSQLAWSTITQDVLSDFVPKNPILQRKIIEKNKKALEVEERLEQMRKVTFHEANFRRSSSQREIDEPRTSLLPTREPSSSMFTESSND